MQTERFPAIVNAMQGTQLSQGSNTIAEGMAVGTPGQLARVPSCARRWTTGCSSMKGAIEQAIVILLEVEDLG